MLRAHGRRRRAGSGNFSVLVSGRFRGPGRSPGLSTTGRVLAVSSSLQGRMQRGGATVGVAEHVLFGERQGTGLRVVRLFFQKMAAQERQLLQGNLVFAN